MATPTVEFLVFDVESVADGDLVSKLRYPGQGLSATDAIARYRKELMEQNGTDFIPYTFQLPISLVAAKVGRDYRLIDLVSLDEPQFRPHIITEHFWRGWEHYKRPTLVSFNGRTFDLPLLELAAFRYGLSAPGWFNVEDKSFEQNRNRYNLAAHFDLQELLTNYGSSRFTGGLNLASNLIGKPGKMEVQGYMVQDMYFAGKHQEINDYCLCDVLDTYFVFLRTRVLLGLLNLDKEQTLVNETRQWLTERAETHRAYRLYMERWSDWENPWKKEGKEGKG